MDLSAKVDQLLIEQQIKQWIELAGFAITIILTGQKDIKDREENDEDVEEEDRKDGFISLNRSAFNGAAR